MHNERFIVTGGFRDENSSEGYLGQVELNIGKKSASINFTPLLVTEPPDDRLRMPNKGFTGASIYNNLLWVCTANQVLGYCLHNLELKHIVNNTLFNDLHHVFAQENKLYVANTGLESIDCLDYSGELLERILLTSDDRTSARTQGAREFRTSYSEPHFMHVNFCAYNERGELMATLARQGYVVNLKNWSLVSPLYPAPPHDGFMAYHQPKKKKLLWATLVSGQVIASDADRQQVATWNLKNHNIPIGWARGLCVLEHGLLVGTSKLTKSNYNYPYYNRWSIKDCENSETTIAYIPFDSTRAAIFTPVFPDRKAAKIFSIIKNDEDNKG